MGRPKKQEDIDLAEGQTEEQIPELQELQAQLGGDDYSVKVSRLKDDKSDWENIKTYAAGEFSPDTVAEQYGGGKYKFVIYDASKKYVKSYTASYAQKKQPVEQKKDDSQNSMINFMATQLANQNALTIKLIEGLASRPQEKSTSPTLTEMITLLGTFKNISGTGSENNISKIMEIFKMGFEMSKGLTGAEGAGEPVENKLIMRIAEELLPKLLGAGQRLVNPSKNSTTPPVVAPADPAPAQLNGGEKKTMEFVTTFEKNLFDKLDFNKDIITMFAKKDFDIEQSGDYFIEQFSDIEIQELDNYLSKYNYYRIVELIPEFKPYEIWFEKLIKYVMEEVKEILKPEENTGEDKDPEVI